MDFFSRIDLSKMKQKMMRGDLRAGHHMGKLLRRGKVEIAIEALVEESNKEIREILSISLASWLIKKGHFRDGIAVLENIDKENRQRLIKNRFVKHLYKVNPVDDVEVMKLLEYTRDTIPRDTRQKIEKRLLGAVF